MKRKDDIAKLHVEEIYDHFLVKSNQFNGDYRANESIRVTGRDQLTEAEVMMHFLVDLNSEELAEAAQSLPMTENKLEQQDNEDVAAAKAVQRLKQIKVWSDVAGNFTQEDKTETIRNHKERLARYRKRKDWEAWIEEDELDIEGDRLISEIKNYKSEHFFNTRFYT